MDSVGIQASISAFFFLKYKPTFNRRVAALLFIGCAIWMLAVLFELTNANFKTILFWTKIEYIGVVTVPVTFFIITLLYCGYEKWVTLKKVILLSIIPFITLVLSSTNELHGLIWKSLKLTTVNFGTVMIYEYGTWFWLFALYMYILLISSYIILLSAS